MDALRSLIDNPGEYAVDKLSLEQELHRVEFFRRNGWNVEEFSAGGGLGASRAGAGLAKDSVIEGFKLSNHAFRKGVLGRGATEEIVSGAIRGAREAGTVTTEVATGKFAGNTIEVFVHNGVKVVTDSTQKVIMSIQNLSGFHF